MTDGVPTQSQTVQAVDVPIQAPVSPVSQVVEPVEQDRSAFNCEFCSGEGLLLQDKICSACQGTGKKQGEFASMPVGTTVITKNGTYAIDNNGNLVEKEVII